MLMIFSGLRHEVGGDWLTYHANALDYFELNFGYMSIFLTRDFLWEVSTVFSLLIGGGLIFHNLLMAIIFYVCLHQFIKRLPYYEIALITSFPIFTLILHMGYSRQSLAVAFTLLSINALINKNTIKYFLWIIIGALFHKSALLLLILLLSQINIKKNFKFQIQLSTILIRTFIFLLIIFSFYFIYAEYIHRLYFFYVGDGLHQSSGGSPYRCGLNFIAALIYLSIIFKKVENKQEQKIYFILSICSIVFFFLQFYLSTFSDRLSFYIAPLQLYTWCYLLLFIKDKIIKLFTGFVLVSTYLLMLIIWFNLGISRFTYIPYNNFITSNCIRSAPHPEPFETIKTSKHKWSHFRLYTDYCDPMITKFRYPQRAGFDSVMELKQLQFFNRLKYDRNDN